MLSTDTSLFFTAMFFCNVEQIQVVEEASATSPDIPESGLSKTLKQKGEHGSQLCFKFILLKR